jgi:hypothetical protein
MAVRLHRRQPPALKRLALLTVSLTAARLCRLQPLPLERLAQQLLL